MTQINDYKYRFLVAGIFALIFGLSELRTVFTFKCFLAPIKGIVTSANTYITTVTSQGRYGHEDISQASELIFYMRGKEKQFRLAKNIGEKFIDEEYESMKKDLELADSVAVWVRKSELDEFKPQIFQIEIDGEIILPHDVVRTENSLLAFFMTLIGISFLTLFSFAQFPHFMQRLFKMERRIPNG